MMAPAPAAPDQRTVFITGGSSGIGRSTAGVFAGAGWRVGLIARGGAGLTDIAAELLRNGVRVATAQADVADPAALAHAVHTLVAALGPPDVWINCAGNGVYGRFTDVSPEEYDRVTSVTYGGTVNGCRTALALMAPRGRGRIVNVCSAAAFHGLPLMTSYAGAKAGVRAFAQALRAELRMAGSPIRVVTVFPPAVNTPFFSHAPSHMAWPARPAPPVYQPEVVAAGIFRAARYGGAEQTITGVATLFELATRVCPGVIAWCMTQIGFDGQLSHDPEAVRLVDPTLFAPSSRPSPERGPFGARARARSTHLWLMRVLSFSRQDVRSRPRRR